MAASARLNQAAVRIAARDAAFGAHRCSSTTGRRNLASTSKVGIVSLSGSSSASTSAIDGRNSAINTESRILLPPHFVTRNLSSSTSLQASSTNKNTNRASSSPAPPTSTSEFTPPSAAHFKTRYPDRQTGNTLPKSIISKNVLDKIAKVMGYDSRTAGAIRATSDYYDRCSERDELEGTFWYDECGLPVSYQSWMQITNLHIWLLSVRFRSLPAPLGKSYIQEIVNHYFIHSESLMRGRYNIRQNRLIKGYLRDMLYQYHGANMGYDEGLISGSDAVLAAAVWRNLFGAGWGRMGGVTGKLNEDGKEITSTSSPLEKDASIKQKNKEEKMSFEEAIAELDPGSAPPPPSASGAPSAPPGVKVGNQAGGYHSGGSGLITPLPLNEPAELRGVVAKEARFAINLERLVKWIRREVRRMENIPDQLIMTGYGMDSQKGRSLPGSLTDFSRI